MRETADSGTGITSRRRSFCDSRTIGMACVCDEVPAWIIAPVSAYRRVMTPANGAVMRA